MRTLSVSLPLIVVAAAVCAGCAQTRGDTTAMGASRAPQTVMCRDAAWVSDASQCGDHGGVERAMSPSTQK